MEIVLIGLNHRTATVELRERVRSSVQQAWRPRTSFVAAAFWKETLVLSTCNRSGFTVFPRAGRGQQRRHPSCSSRRFNHCAGGTE